MRAGIVVKVSASDRARLEAVVRDRSSPQKHVWRARIVLLTADGVGTNEIRRQAGVAKTAVWRWQERYVKSWAGWRRKADPQAAAGVASGQPLFSRHVARLLMADPAILPEAEQVFVSALLQKAPDLASGIAVAKRINLLFRRKSQEDLEVVLADAAATPLAEFAASLRHDLAAVQATLDLPWTTNSAEGQINRLKMLKRTMFGRAGFPLLRARVFHAA